MEPGKLQRGMSLFWLLRGYVTLRVHVVTKVVLYFFCGLICGKQCQHATVLFLVAVLEANQRDPYF